MLPPPDPPPFGVVPPRPTQSRVVMVDGDTATDISHLYGGGVRPESKGSKASPAEPSPVALPPSPFQAWTAGPAMVPTAPLPSAVVPVRGRSVAFTFPGRGRLTVAYHAVVRSDPALVLIYDHRAGTLPHFALPPPDADPVPLGLEVAAEGDEPATAYVCFHTGVRYSYRDCEHFVLVIDRASVAEHL